MLSLATLPNPATFMTDIGAWSSPIFTDLLPFAVFAIGIILGFAFIRFIINTVSNATDNT